MEKLLIVDGCNLLFQMFFGMSSRIVNKDGKAIQGVLGFVGAFIKIIKMTSPTHLIILFDGEHEADDVISSYVLKYEKKMEIIISSFDSDFFQLINDSVSILRYRGDHTILCDPSYIRNKYGISPGQYADFKALTGDPSDNIKGAEKVGPKTAAALINQFGSLHNVVTNAGEITKPSIRESILRNTERLHNNYKLIKLDDKAGIPFDISELIYNYNGITTNEVLAGINLK